MYLCEICGIKTKKIGVHIKSHNMTSKEYYDKYIKKDGDEKCNICGNSTKFLGVTKGYNKYCSMKCRNNDKKYIEILSKQKIGKKRNDMVGDLNPAKDKNVRTKISKKKIEEWNKENSVYKTEKYKNKKMNSMKNMFKGKTYEEMYGKEVSDKLKKIRSDQLKNGQAIKMCIKAGSNKISKPQKELYDKIRKIYDDVLLEYRVSNYSIDIAIPSLFIGIEYDCSYWHNSDKDKIRDNKLLQEGWKIIRFKDYVPDIKELFEKIKEVS